MLNNSEKEKQQNKNQSYQEQNNILKNGADLINVQQIEIIPSKLNQIAEENNNVSKAYLSQMKSSKLVSEIKGRVCQFYLQNTNNEDTKRLKYYIINQNQQAKQFKQLEHYQESKNPFLKPQEEKNEQLMYLYYGVSCPGFSNEEDKFTLCVDDQGQKFPLEFSLQPMIDVLFLDVSSLENKIHQKDITYEKQFDNDCLTFFGVQIFLKEKFHYFIKFCQQYYLVFKRDIFQSTISYLGINHVNDDQCDFKYLLMLIYLESINKKKQEYISDFLNPKQRYLFILNRHISNDEERITKMSQELNQYEEWNSMKRQIEDLFVRYADFEYSKQYFKIKRALQLVKTTRDILESKIISAFEPNLTSLFNKQYMEESKMDAKEYYFLFIKQQQFLENKSDFLNYLKQNKITIKFLLKIASQYDEIYDNVIKSIENIIYKLNKDSNAIQFYSDFNNNKALFESILPNTQNILKQINPKQKLQQLKLQDLDDKGAEKFDQFLNNNNMTIEDLLKLLQNITFLSLDENSNLYKMTNKIIDKAISLFNQQKDLNIFKESNFGRTLVELCMKNWKDLNDEDKIRSCIIFEVWYCEFQKQCNQQLVPIQDTVLKYFLKTSDICYCLKKLISAIQNESLPQQHQQKLKQQIFDQLSQKIIQIERISQLNSILSFLDDNDDGEAHSEAKRSNEIMGAIVSTLKKLTNLNPASKNAQDLNQLNFEQEKLLEDDQQPQLIKYKIEFLISGEIFLQVFKVLKDNLFFVQSSFYKSVKESLTEYLDVENILWSEYKYILENPDRFFEFLKYLGLQQQKKDNAILKFQQQYEQLKSFISIMKRKNANNIDQCIQIIENIDNDIQKDRKVKDVYKQFTIKQQDIDFISISVDLNRLQLFNKLADLYVSSNQSIIQITNEIKLNVIPRMYLIYKFIIEEELGQRIEIDNEDLQKIIDQYQEKHVFRNYYQIIEKYFLDYHKQSDQDIEQECKHLHNVCENKYSVSQDLTAQQFKNFYKEGYERVRNFNILTHIIKNSELYQIKISSLYQNKDKILEQLHNQDKLTKNNFMKETDNINMVFENYFKEVQQESKITVTKDFFQKEVLDFIPCIFNVIRFHRDYKNEDVTELQFDDDNDLALRIIDYISVKDDLEEFSKLNKELITDQIKLIINHFWSSENFKGIREKIAEISKFQDNISQRILESRDKESYQNSVELLEKITQNGKIYIQISEAYIKQNSIKKKVNEEMKQKNKENQKKKAQKSIFNKQVDNKYNLVFETKKTLNNNNKEIILQFDEEDIFQMIQRLNLISEEQLQQAFSKRANHKKDEEYFKENRIYFEQLFNSLQHLIKALEQLIIDGYLDDFVSEIVINLVNRNFKDQILEIQKITSEKQQQLKDWEQQVKHCQDTNPVMKLISPTNYPDLFRYILRMLDQNINPEIKSYTINQLNFKTQQFGQSNDTVTFCIEEMVKFYFMNLQSIQKFDKNKLIDVSKRNLRLGIIGECLNYSFQNGEKILIFNQKEQLEKLSLYQSLSVKKIKSDNYQQMCSKILTFFSNQKPNRLQFFFGNESSTEKDVQAFLNRVIYFELNDQQRHFFLVDFQRLKYQVQLYTLSKIYEYMNKECIEKTQNELYIIYIYNLNSSHGNPDCDDSWDDQIQVPIHEIAKKPQYSNQNVYVFKSSQPGKKCFFQQYFQKILIQKGVGKTYQIHQMIKDKNQQLMRIPAHQFENIDNLVKILKKKQKQIKQAQVQGFHIEIIYDPQDKVSLFLLQVLVLNCINLNLGRYFVFNPSSIFYIEQSNYYEIPYASILDSIFMDGSQKFNIQFKLDQYQVKKKDQIMLKYLYGLDKDPLEYFKLKDFKVHQFYPHMQVQKERIFTNKEAQQLIQKFFIGKLKSEQQKNVTFKHIKMFKKQIVILLQNMEDTYQYTSHYLNNEVQNTSPEFNECKRYVRNYMIKQIVEQSFINTILNESQETQQQENNFNYMVGIIENIINQQIEQLKEDEKNIAGQYLLESKIKERNYLRRKKNLDEQEKKKNRKNQSENQYLLNNIEQQKEILEGQSNNKKKNCLLACIQCLFKSQNSKKNYQERTTNKNTDVDEDEQNQLNKKFEQLEEQYKNMEFHDKEKQNHLKQEIENQKKQINLMFHNRNDEIVDLSGLSKIEKIILKKNSISQYDKQINNLVFFLNQSMTAAIFTNTQLSKEMNNLQALMRTFISYYNQRGQKVLNADEIEQQLSFIIPHLYQNNEYLLLRTLVYVCSQNPSSLLSDERQEYSQTLQKILAGTVFSNDNVCKLIQISYKIYSGIPIIIMGHTGIGKTVSVYILSQIMGYKFQIIRVSAGTTTDQIIKSIKKAQRKVIKMKLKNKQSKLVVFFDEINTNQNIHGLLKEILVDKCMNGEKICQKDEIICIGACNPYEYIKYKQKDEFVSGLLTRIQKEISSKPMLSYKVFPLPESMIPYVVNYDQLSLKSEINYIYQMLQKINLRNQSRLPKKQLEQGENQQIFEIIDQYYNPKEIECIQDMIMKSQQFIRYFEKSSRAVSLRDVKRTILLIQFFLNIYFKKRGELTQQDQKQSAVILSLYLSYQIRLNSQERREIYQTMIMDSQKNSCLYANQKQQSFYNDCINKELNYFINQLKIDEKQISKNKALKENCFCIAICIQNKIPLFITGEPGTSKTLSFAIVMNSFKGLSSASLFLKNFPSIKEFYIQGNLQTQSDEIRLAFEKARDHNRKHGNTFSIPVVFFDEIGQAELSENNPNKVLHELLDDEDISFVASSNHCLDSAKQNRFLHLQRNKNSLQDLKEFVRQLVNDNNDLKDMLLNNDVIKIKQFCDVYYKFHEQSKNYIHNTRDFYYTIKYCCYKASNSTQVFTKKMYLALLYKSMVKNFSGYNENLEQIKSIFCKNFKNHIADIQQEISIQDILDECFQPICHNFAYHSRFPMFIAKNPYQALQFVTKKLNERRKSFKVKTGSHFKQDHNEDRTREISSINACIESGQCIVSINQSYVYAAYYDFFTMNFVKIGDKQKFRLNYKQIQTRIEVRQDYLFIMIVSQDEYMKMDLALLNRFEKHNFTETLILSEYEKSVLENIIKLLQEFKKNLHEDKYFLGFLNKTFVSGLVLEQSQKLILQNQEQLFNNCMNAIGDLCSKYDIVRLRNMGQKDAQIQYKKWNSYTYLDNLIEFVFQKFQNNRSFTSIIYTLSYLHSTYEILLKQINVYPKLIDLDIIKKKIHFEKEISDYFKNNENNLVIIKISSSEEDPKNIYYIRNYLDEELRLNQQISKSDKSVIILIQHNDPHEYRLPFCDKWDQYQIDNLLPYVYNQLSSHLMSQTELQKIDEILNYRRIHGKNDREILENDLIFHYIINMQGFSSRLIQKMVFEIQPESESLLDYYEITRILLANQFKDQKSLVYQKFYEYFKKKMAEKSNQDENWSYKYNLITGINYEKSMINYLKKKVEDIVLTIFVQFEQNNFLTNLSLIQNFKYDKAYQQLLIRILNKLIEESVIMRESNQIHMLPYLSQKHVFSNFIFKKIEISKKQYDTMDLEQFNLNLERQLEAFKDLKIDFTNYIDDFLVMKKITMSENQTQQIEYKQFCQNILVQLNKSSFFHSYFQIHEIFWKNEIIFEDIIDNLCQINFQKLIDSLVNYLIQKQVFQNNADIIEAVSEFIFDEIKNMKNVDEQIQLINCILNVFPSSSSTKKFNLVRLSHQSLKQFIKEPNILVSQFTVNLLLISFQKNQLLFQAFSMQEAITIYGTLQQAILQSQDKRSEYLISVLSILFHNKININTNFEDLIVEGINFMKQKNFGNSAFIELKIMLQHFTKLIKDDISNSFIVNYSQILQDNQNNINFLKEDYLNILNRCLLKNNVKTEDLFTQLLIRIGEIVFYDVKQIFSIDPNLIIKVFQKYEEQPVASVQFIFSAILLRIISPVQFFFQIIFYLLIFQINYQEIVKIVQENIFKDTFNQGRFDQLNIQDFFIELSKVNSVKLFRDQYLQIYIIKLIYHSNPNFVVESKKKLNAKMRDQFLFIFKLLSQLEFFLDGYKFPWFEEILTQFQQFFTKINTLENIMPTLNPQKSFLLYSTIQMLIAQKEQQIIALNPQFNNSIQNMPLNINIFDKIKLLKNNPSLQTFLIYLSSRAISGLFKNLQQVFGQNSSFYLNSIYVPFNSLSEEQILIIERERALNAVQDGTLKYVCSCGLPYVVGDCGQNMVTVRCSNCGNKIGGQNHVNINQVYSGAKNLQYKTGLNNSFIKDLYNAPRDLNPTTFRFGNLVVYALILISGNTTSISQSECVKIIQKQWSILIELLKLSEEQIVIISIELLQKLLNINDQNLKVESNRQMFEKQFNQEALNVLNTAQKILEDFANKVKLQQQSDKIQQEFYSILREEDKEAPFRNTLQAYKIPNLQDLQNKYILNNNKLNLIYSNLEDIKKVQLIYPLIYFYKKIHQFFSKKYTERFISNKQLSFILNNKPCLLNYFNKNVRDSWNQICDCIKGIKIGCKLDQPVQKIENAEQIEFESFLIVKKKNQNESHQSDYLKRFIDFFKDVQNIILKEINVISNKNLFDFYPFDVIIMSESILHDDLLMFESFQLEVKQEKREIEQQLLINYFISENLENKSLFAEFNDVNYFEFMDDVNNLGYIYPPSILQNYLTKLTENEKEKFLKMCPQEEQKLEIRTQLFYLHKYLKNLPKSYNNKQKEIFQQKLMFELKSHGFIIDEAYFENSLQYFQVSHICDLLVILETELMSNLVNDIRKQYQEKLDDKQFEEFKKQFSSKVIIKAQNELNNLLNQKNLSESQQMKYKSQKINNYSLLKVLGRYIIRNLITTDISPESNIFEMIKLCFDSDFFEPLLIGENEEVDFQDLNICHKHIFDLYKRIEKLHQAEYGCQQKEEEKRRDLEQRNRNNQQKNLFGYQMDKQQLKDNIDLIPNNLIAQIKEIDINDDQELQNDDRY